MTSDEFELRLIGADAPDGQVRLEDLAALAQGFQDLSLRVGRELADRAGPGRTDRNVRALTEMRLSGLGRGSTRLHFARGRQDGLDLELAEAADLDAKFWEVVDAVRTNSRPPWIPDLIAESASKVVTALKASAPVVELTRPAVGSFRMVTQELRSEVWARTLAVTDAESVVVTGQLEAVDLRSSRFRISDDMGHRIPLEDVPRAAEVGHLIGHRVRATGFKILGSDGQLKGIKGPAVEEESIPPSWSFGAARDWTSELSKPGPVAGDGVELSDEEFASLISAVKG